MILNNKVGIANYALKRNHFMDVRNPHQTACIGKLTLNGYITIFIQFGKSALNECDHINVDFPTHVV